MASRSVTGLARYLSVQEHRKAAQSMTDETKNQLTAHAAIHDSGTACASQAGDNQPDSAHTISATHCAPAAPEVIKKYEERVRSMRSDGVVYADA